jgi:hypothetical protein
MAAPRNFAVVFDRGVSSTDLADRRAASAIQREASDTRNEIQKLMASLRWRRPGASITSRNYGSAAPVVSDGAAQGCGLVEG